MRLLIKGIDMPETCQYCPCCVEHDYKENKHFCSVWGDDIDNMFSGRLDTCPIVEIHAPHGRLIDADAIMDLLEKSVPEQNRGHQFYVFRHMLRNAPTIIEAEETSER